MDFLTRLKIGSRLALGFALVLGLTLIVGVFSINRIGHVNAATEELATNWFPAIKALSDYRAAINGLHRSQGEHLLSTTPEDRATQMQSIKSYKDKAQENWRAYESTVTTDEERQLAKGVQVDQERYYAVMTKVLALSDAGAERLEEAKGVFKGESRDAFRASFDAVQRSIDFQTEGANAAYERSQAAYQQTIVAVTVLVVLAILIGAGMAFTITRSIVTPIARALKVAETVAAGDLTSDLHTDAQDETGQLLRALKRMNDSLVTIVGQVRNGSDSIATGSSQISSGNTDLSQRTEEQASALQQTAATMDQLSSTVRNNADNAKQANQLAHGASVVATKGGDVVGKVVETMKGINDASKKISDIISVIDGIAFQTNILALNAAVEAARAGEQGRGFAVVASEVRNLAQRSAGAAKEIKSLITNSVEQVAQGTQLVDEAGHTMSEIVGAVKRVSDIVAEISAASVEQSSGITQVGQAITQMDTVTQQNAALVEESAAAALSLRQQATQLVDAVAVFKLAHGMGAAQPRAKASARSAPAAAPRAPQPALAKATSEPGGDDWQDF